MFTTIEQRIVCPYCGEKFEIVIDGSVESQIYTEDCYVCCRPIVFNASVDEYDKVSVLAQREDEC